MPVMVSLSSGIELAHGGTVQTGGICFGLALARTSTFPVSSLTLPPKVRLFKPRGPPPGPSPFIRACMGCAVNLLNFSACCVTFISLLSSIGWRPVMVSNVFMGVDFMAPVIMRAATFCVLLTLPNCVEEAPDQAEMPYSSTGLTLPV